MDQTPAGEGQRCAANVANVEADLYVLVNGDDISDASAAPMLIEHLLTHSLDMVNASRVETGEAAYRPGHRFGNCFLTGVLASVFGKRLCDMLSGYWVFSRRFVKSFPSLSSGFEIETALTVHALELRLPIAEIPMP
jgi:hypothetical protein